MADPITKTFPANVDESQRWTQPSPTHKDVERRSSGDLPDQPEGLEVDALDGNPTPYTGMRTGR